LQIRDDNGWQLTGHPQATTVRLDEIADSTGMAARSNAQRKRHRDERAAYRTNRPATTSTSFNTDGISQ